MERRGHTLILGYSTAGNSPSNVDLNNTIPEYSAWFACRVIVRWLSKVTGTIPNYQLSIPVPPWCDGTECRNEWMEGNEMRRSEMVWAEMVWGEMG